MKTNVTRAAACPIFTHAIITPAMTRENIDSPNVR